jgi:hypothetical protein
MKSTVLTTKPGVEGSVGLQSRLSELDLALGQELTVVHDTLLQQV